jgi:hypothetical protein
MCQPHLHQHSEEKIPSPSTSATSTAPSLFGKGLAIQQAACHRPRRCQHSSKGLAIDLGDIDCTFANTSARGSLLTSMTSTAPSPTLRQGTHHRPQRHQPHPHQHFGKGLTIGPRGNQHSGKGLAFDLDDINRTFAIQQATSVTSTARGSLSTLATSTTPSPTLRQRTHHRPR